MRIVLTGRWPRALSAILRVKSLVSCASGRVDMISLVPVRVQSRPRHGRKR